MKIESILINIPSNLDELEKEHNEHIKKTRKMLQRELKIQSSRMCILAVIPLIMFEHQIIGFWVSSITANIIMKLEF